MDGLYTMCNWDSFTFMLKFKRWFILNIQEMQKYCIEKLKENNIDEYNLKTKLLICKTINKEKEYLIVHDKEELKDTEVLEIKANLNKIIEGVPIQYITGHQSFMGLDFFVNENVLIPQPDTEMLVEETINVSKENYKILDLCTGSGAIATSLKYYLKNVEVMASDISEKALEVAKINADKNGMKIDFIKSNLFENINKKFNVIVSNPPYIKTEVIENLSKEVQKEPHLALDGGQDGLNFYRKIINEAYKYLENDGYLLLEIGYDQKVEVIKLIEENSNYQEIYSKKDLAGNDRIVVCKRREI